MIDNFRKVISDNYSNFKGRATRSEYWNFFLANMIAVLLLKFIGGLALGAWGVRGLPSIYMIAILCPSIAVAVRRLHDTGRSGWHVLLGSIPLFGLVLFYFFALDSDPGDNMYGPYPKTPKDITKSAAA